MSTLFADALTGGTIAGTIAAIIIAAICAFVLVAGILSGGEGWGVAIGAAVCLLITAGVYIFAMWPFAYEYHHWVDTRGTVAKIDKRLVPAGDKGMQEKIVVTATDGRLRGVTDTRATTLQAGDKFYFRCKKAYEFGVSRGAHGWDCKWAG